MPDFMKWHPLLVLLSTCSALAGAEVPAVADSLSPDGTLHAVIDLDRDPSIVVEWKGDSWPQIEITEKATGKVVAKIQYFGACGDDLRPLREHVNISWRKDSKAFGVAIVDRFYTSAQVHVSDGAGGFKEVQVPGYQEMTGFPPPNSDDLRPRGRSGIIGWTDEGLLIYGIFFSPLPTYSGRDPLQHRVLLEVTRDQMIPRAVEHETGVWKNGSWVAD